MSTLNSERTLRECLNSISKQSYDDDINIIMVDGGSTDGTLDIAKDFGIKPIVNKGQYITLLNGSNNYGISIAKDPYIMLMDSDNVLFERDFIKFLAYPLVNDHTINLSFPLIKVGDETNSFNRWMNLLELNYQKLQLQRANEINNLYCIIERAFHGLPNVNMTRKIIWERIGGYDQDWRVMRRIMDLNLAKTAIVQKCHYSHLSVDNPIEFIKKWSKRVKFYANIDPDLLPTLRNCEFTSIDRHEVLKTNFGHMKSSLMQFRKSYDVTWLWGLSYPIIMMLVLLSNPLAFIKGRKNW